MYFSRPCNFAIFEGLSSEFDKVGYFDMLIKFQYFINIISFADTLQLKMSLTLMTIRMTSLEGTHFIFSYEN